MDFAAIVGALTGLLVGVVATAVALRKGVIPALQKLAKLTPTDVDDRALRAVDVAIASVQEALEGFLGQSEPEPDDAEDEAELAATLEEARVVAKLRVLDELEEGDTL